MTAPPPADVRYSTNALFPSLVTGTGPIVINKVNGIWSVSFQMAPLAHQMPPFVDASNEYFTLWNSNSNAFSKSTLQDVLSQVVALSSQVFTTRAIAAATIIPNVATFVRTLGYYASGDGGGALYVKALGSTPGGFQSADSAWWELEEKGSAHNVKQFGAKGDSVTDDAAAIQAAMDAISNTFPGQGGGVFFPTGVYKYSSDIIWTKHYVLWFGNGMGSILQASNNAKIIIGSTTSNIDVLFPQIQNLDFAAETNHDGAIIVADLTQNFSIRDCIVGVRGNDGSTQTDGLRLNSCQYTVVDNIQSLVNGYNIHVYLGNYTSPPIPPNEGHLTIRNCFLYASKTLKAGSFPSCIAIERAAGRPFFTGIDQISVHDTHMGKFIDGGTALCAGIRLISENPGVQTKITHAANIQTCMFEGLDYGWSAFTATDIDTSSASFKNCYFLSCGVCIQGRDVSRSFYQLDGCDFVQSGDVTVGVRGYWYGFNNTSNISGQLFTNYRAQRLTNKAFFGSVGFTTTLKASGDAIIGNGIDTTFTITHGLESEGVAIAPDVVFAQMQSGVTFKISINNITDTTFDVVLDSAPGGGSHLLWQAEIVES